MLAVELVALQQAARNNQGEGRQANYNTSRHAEPQGSQYEDPLGQSLSDLTWANDACLTHPRITRSRNPRPSKTPDVHKPGLPGLPVIVTNLPLATPHFVYPVSQAHIARAEKVRALLVKSIPGWGKHGWGKLVGLRSLAIPLRPPPPLLPHLSVKYIGVGAVAPDITRLAVVGVDCAPDDRGRRSGGGMSGGEQGLRTYDLLSRTEMWMERG